MLSSVFSDGREFGAIIGFFSFDWFEKIATDENLGVFAENNQPINNSTEIANASIQNRHPFGDHPSDSGTSAAVHSYDFL